MPNLLITLHEEDLNALACGINAALLGAALSRDEVRAMRHVEVLVEAELSRIRTMERRLRDLQQDVGPA